MHKRRKTISNMVAATVENCYFSHANHVCMWFCIHSTNIS